MWKSILGAWINVRLGLTEEDPTSRAEMLRQPLFGNPSFTNIRGLLLGVSGQSEGCAFARSRHTRVKYLWNQEAQDWKNLSNLRMHFHASNRASKDIIFESIPRQPDSFSSRARAQPSDWISSIAPRSGALLEWVYYVLESLLDKVLVLEFRRVSASRQLRATRNTPSSSITTPRSEFFLKKDTELPSKSPEILPLPARETQPTGFL